VILALAVLASVVVGLAVGGRLSGLERIKIRGWPLLIIAVLLQVYVVGRFDGDTVGPFPVRAFTFVLTQSSILLVALANLGLGGFGFVTLGSMANLAALLANGGLMPVSAEARVAIGHQATVTSLAAGAAVMGSKGVVLPPDQANLWILTDIFALPPPFPLPAVASVGDILVAMGVAYLIVNMMRQSSGAN